jgi:CBS domain containing-hemolysin-like protein
LYQSRLAPALAPRPWRWLIPVSMTLASLPSQASMFKGDTLDAVANGLSWFLLFALPIAGIAAFWMVHILPEKIAHKRHHPQTQAIQVLCLLSLVFGGMLWPIAWLWAYTRPTAYRMAYGTEKHEDYHVEMARKLREGKLSNAEIGHLRDELAAMQAKGALPAHLQDVPGDLRELARKSAADGGGA